MFANQANAKVVTCPVRICARQHDAALLTSAVKFYHTLCTMLACIHRRPSNFISSPTADIRLGATIGLDRHELSSHHTPASTASPIVRRKSCFCDYNKQGAHGQHAAARVYSRLGVRSNSFVNEVETFRQYSLPFRRSSSLQHRDSSVGLDRHPQVAPIIWPLALDSEAVGGHSPKRLTAETKRGQRDVCESVCARA
eukprot:5721912-Pleurochrysis_carterae.AAC.1